MNDQYAPPMSMWSDLVTLRDLEEKYMTFNDPNLRLYVIEGITQDNFGTEILPIRFFQYGTSPEDAIVNRKILERHLSGDRFSFIATKATLSENVLPIAKGRG